MSDYRDPKVTKTTGGENGAGKWIGIAVVVILALLLLGWLLGWFGGDVETVETTDPAVTEEPAGDAAVVEEPVVEEPAPPAPAN